MYREIINDLRELIIDHTQDTGEQTMLYLTYRMIPSVDLTIKGYLVLKIWASADHVITGQNFTTSASLY